MFFEAETLTMTQHLSGGRGALAVAMAAALVLGACAETQLGAQVVKNVARTGDGSPAPARNAAADPSLAPDVFDVTGLTIWDGAATLQGVWLAHPLAQRAQRVQVSNLENGQVTEGAMFRRDPTLSGPSILVSSDAARALGLTPGSPAELRIVALREGPAPTRVAAAPAGEAAPAEGAEPPSGGEVETAALAPPASGAAAPEDAALSDAGTVAPEPEPKAAEEPAETVVPQPLPEPEKTAAAPADPAPEARPEEPAIKLEETTEAKTAPAPQPRPVQTAAAEPQPAAPSADEGALPAPANGALPSGDYLQIGSFSVEYNAQLLVRRLRAAGQPAQYVNREISGKPFAVVVIGPLAGPAAIDAAKAASAAEGQPKPLKVTL